MRIQACSDLHLNNANYGRGNKDGLSFRTTDFMSAFEQSVTQCIESNNIDRIVLCGDEYDNPNPPNPVRRWLMAQIRRLVDAKIKVDILVGNHDACYFNHALEPVEGANFPGVRVYYTPTIEDTDEALLLFFPHSQAIERNETTFRSALLDFAKSSAKVVAQAKKVGKPVLFFGHFPVFGAMMNDGAKNSDSGAIQERDLKEMNADYMFLGDFHGHQTLNVPGTVAMYVGSLERSGFGDRDSTKGYVIYDTAAEKIAPLGKARFVPTKSRKMIDVDGTAQDIMERLKDQSDEMEGAIVRITFRGSPTEYKQFTQDVKPLIKKAIEKAEHSLFEKKLVDPERESKVQEIKKEIEDAGHLESSDIVSVLSGCIERDIQDPVERNEVLNLFKEIVKMVQDRMKTRSSGKTGRVRIHGVKLHNFQRYGEDKNIVEFDPGASEFLSILGTGDKISKNELPGITSSSKRFLTSLDLTAKKLISIEGRIDGSDTESNGSGKTGILEAISYGFFEKIVREFILKDQVRGSSTTSVIRTIDGVMAKDCHVEILFSSEDELWLLKRGRKTTGSGAHSGVLCLFCLTSPTQESGSYSGHRKEDAESVLFELLQMDYETFANSIMFGQNDAGMFIRGTDKVKKEILIKILRLTILDSYLKEVRDRKNVETKASDALQAQVSALSESLLSPEASENLKKRIKDLSESSVEKESKATKADEDAREARNNPIFAQRDSSKAMETKQAEIIAAKKKEISQKNDATTKNLVSATVAAEKLAKQVKEADSSVETSLKSISEAKKKLDCFNEAAVNKELDIVAKAKEAKPKRDAEMKSIQEKIAALSSEKGKHQALMASAKSEMQKFQNQLNKCGSQDNMRCPECESEVSPDHIRNKIAEKQTKIDEAQKALDDIKTKMDETDKEKQEVAKRLANIEDYMSKEAGLVSSLNSNKALKESIKVSEDLLKERQERAESLRKDASEKAQEVQRLKGEVDSMKAQEEAELKPLKDELERLSNEFNSLCSQASQAEKSILSTIQVAKDFRESAKKEAAEIASLTSRISESETIAKRIGDKVAENKSKQQLVSRLEMIDSYLGLDGIRMQIIDKYLPVLNDYIAGFLELTSKGRMEAVVRADKKDKIEMTVTGSSAPSPELVSGGEFVALRLAVDLGLGMLSMLRNDNAPDFVCLDEVFAPVDTAGKWRMFEVVNKLQEYFRTVIVISHDAFIREKIKNTIMVHKVNDVSTIEKQVFEPTLFQVS